MKRRSWWVEIPNFNTVFNFKWQPTSYKLKYKDLGKERNLKQMVNHLEYHKCISEKSELFKHLQIYCEQMRSNVFKITPLTFFVTIDITKPNAMNSSLAAFETIFNVFEHTKKYRNTLCHSPPKNALLNFFGREENDKERRMTEGITVFQRYTWKI